MLWDSRAKPAGYGKVIGITRSLTQTYTCLLVSVFRQDVTETDVKPYDDDDKSLGGWIEVSYLLLSVHLSASRFTNENLVSE